LDLLYSKVQLLSGYLDVKDSIFVSKTTSAVVPTVQHRLHRFCMGILNAKIDLALNVDEYLIDEKWPETPNFPVFPKI
jgi:hypothetical protein